MYLYYLYGITSVSYANVCYGRGGGRERGGKRFRNGEERRWPTSRAGRYACTAVATAAAAAAEKRRRRGARCVRRAAATGVRVRSGGGKTGTRWKIY